MRLTLAVAVIVALAAYIVRFGLGEGQPGQLAFDVYGYFYPNMLYALRSLADGGKGLQWNPFQNCGQPFLAVTETGLFYPLNAFFLLAEPQRALRAVLFTNLLIGGLGMYALECELGLGTAGALGGALAFLVANSTYHVTTWMPTVQAPYVWMPVAMLVCERLVKAPSLRLALLLGLVLALGLLPGHPQFALFTCQLVALRLLWSLLERGERRHFGWALGGVAIALVVMLLVTAVQFVPSLQLAAESVRHGSLSAKEIAPMGNDTIAAMVRNIFMHASLAPFSVVQGVLAVAAIARIRRSRAVLFYLAAAVLFLLLSFGDSNAVGRWYYHLPLAGLFRWPLRFRFVTGFCVAVLAGMGVDALSEGRWAAMALAAVAFAAFCLRIGGVPRPDWVLAAAAVGGALVTAAVRRARPLGVTAVLGALFLVPVLTPAWTTQRFLADDHPLREHAALFERLRERLAKQERVQLALTATLDAGFEEKSAMLFELPSITDYETQMTQRYAEYVTMLRSGTLMEGINPVYYPGPWNPLTVRWPLVDLTAVRYLVVTKTADAGPQPFGGKALDLIDSDDTLHVYSNPGAFPRAYYVPQIEVVADPKARLRRLAAQTDAPRLRALVDSAPASGFTGVPGNTQLADATFVVDEPERVVVHTVAPERGFVFLADEYFPAWSATVNGQPTPIQVANHAFRLVEVPGGDVTVEFRYQSRRFWVGTVVSVVSCLAVAAALIWGGRHAWHSPR